MTDSAVVGGEHTRTGPGGFRVSIGEAAGAVADLGVLVPLAAALILVNGLDAGAVFLVAGLFALAAGVWFRVPFPVQPLKALTAVAVAQGVSPGIIHAAGLELAAFLLLLSVRGVADAVARLFTRPVVRALQLGVGLLLVDSAARLVADPPDVFQGTPPSPWPIVLMVAAFAGVLWAARRRHYWAALLLLAAGVAASVALARPDLVGPSLELPSATLPPGSAFGAALFLLTIPQLPLTFGNAVVALDALSHEYFGESARRVTPARICRSAGLGNAASALLGGMPMCHGSGGLTAHVRMGARTAGMNLVLGTVLASLGLFLARDVVTLLGLLPVWTLAAFLAYAGVRHAWLVADLRGAALATAVVAGVAGAGLRNLAITTALALAIEHGRVLVGRRLAGNRTRDR